MGLHVAIIPDGNRRWAKAKGLAATQGHREAVAKNRMADFLRKAKELNIETVSVWLFSTENWKRPERERVALFALLQEKGRQLKEIASDEHVRVQWKGRRDRVPSDLKEELITTEQETEGNSSLVFNMCIDYGGRDEIVRAVNEAVKQGKPVTEESFNQFFDSGEPDLIIRTSGEQRLSGFMPWQGTYAELYFTEKHFPDFGPDDLAAAVDDFKQRHRRFGGD